MRDEKRLKNFDDPSSEGYLTEKKSLPRGCLVDISENKIIFIGNKSNHYFLKIVD